MAHYEMYISLTKDTYNSTVPAVLQPKLGWKVLADDRPTSANTVVEIKAWMDTKSLSYTSDDLKADLLNTVDSTPTEDYTPTWRESAFRGKLGAPRVSLNGGHIILKGEFSMLEGELTAMMALGNGKVYPNNSILTKTEAQTLANGSLFTSG
jgi:hypothetical protein|tara:strand:- start:2367 stop:2822 length:456 start_codon:yes stop_codon:yes gene_type:complete